MKDTTPIQPCTKCGRLMLGDEALGPHAPRWDGARRIDCVGDEVEQTEKGETMGRKATDVAKCRSCNADILWVEWDVTHKKMPVDSTPDMRDPAKGGGNLVLSLRDGEYGTLIVNKYEAQKHGGERNRYTSHFATCPQRNEWRKSE